MEIPRLQKLASEFDERNVVLQLALGCTSYARRFDQLIERYVPGRSGGARAPGDEQLVMFVLGLMSFRDRVVAATEAAGREAKEARWEAADESPGEQPVPRELLR